MFSPSGNPYSCTLVRRGHARQLYAVQKGTRTRRTTHTKLSQQRSRKHDRDQQTPKRSPATYLPILQHGHGEGVHGSRLETKDLRVHVYRREGAARDDDAPEAPADGLEGQARVEARLEAFWQKLEWWQALLAARSSRQARSPGTASASWATQGRRCSPRTARPAGRRPPSSTGSADEAMDGGRSEHREAGAGGETEQRFGLRLLRPFGS